MPLCTPPNLFGVFVIPPTAPPLFIFGCLLKPIFFFAWSFVALSVKPFTSGSFAISFNSFLMMAPLTPPKPAPPNAAKILSFNSGSSASSKLSFSALAFKISSSVLANGSINLLRFSSAVIPRNCASAAASICGYASFFSKAE